MFSRPLCLLCAAITLMVVWAAGHQESPLLDELGGCRGQKGPVINTLQEFTKNLDWRRSKPSLINLDPLTCAGLGQTSTGMVDLARQNFRAGTAEPSGWAV